jgi:hypothetical protein
MAVTKVDVVAWAGQTATAGAAMQYSDAVDIRDAYRAIGYIRIVNGATGPTVPLYAGMQYGIDEENDGDASSGIFWAQSGGGLVGHTGNSATTEKCFEILSAAQFVRFWCGHNTGQDCTIYAGLTKVTSML